MLHAFVDFTLLITLCDLSNVYLLQSIQCVVANVTLHTEQSVVNKR
jgi:hypothetical protein